MALGRKAKARELVRRALLAGEKGWTQLLRETGLARGALSINLRKMRNEKEVVYEVRREGGRPTKMYKLSDRGLVRASVSGLSKGMTVQISSALEKLSHSNPAGIRGWLRGRKKIHLEIEDPGLGRVKITLHPRAPPGRE